MQCRYGTYSIGARRATMLPLDFFLCVQLRSLPRLFLARARAPYQYYQKHTYVQLYQKCSDNIPKMYSIISKIYKDIPRIQNTRRRRGCPARPRGASTSLYILAIFGYLFGHNFLGLTILVVDLVDGVLLFGVLCKLFDAFCI